MRILSYSTIPPGDRGGVQAVQARLCRALRASGHRVTEGFAHAADEIPIAAGVQLDVATSAGSGVSADEGHCARWWCPLEVDSPRSVARVPGTAIRVALAILRLLHGLARLRPDVVNVHFVRGHAAYFLLLRPVFGYRVVLSAHGSDLLAPSEAGGRHLPALVRRADAITVVSADLARAARALPGVEPGRVVLIPNGIEHRFWSASPPVPVRELSGTDAAAADPSGPRVLAVGRLEPIKGLDVLLSAWVRLRERRPRARLVIIGTGSVLGALREQARDLGIVEHVEFTGHLAPAKVRERLAGAAAYVLPSRSEGMPLALLEAMAAGVPVIAARVGGVPEVLGESDGAREPGRHGLLVAAEDADGFARALDRVLGDEALATRLASAARVRAAEYSAERSVAAYESLFESLVAGRGVTGAASGEVIR